MATHSDVTDICVDMNNIPHKMMKDMMRMMVVD